MDIKKILFPTDFSQPADRALDHALVLAHRFKASVLMVHVETPYSADPNNPRKEFPRLDELFRFIREQADSRLNDPHLPVMSGDIEIKDQVLRGMSAAQEILAFADEQKVDLIVMGTHGRSGIGHFLLGSTTEKVVHGSLVPVLTIHSGEDLFLEAQGRYRKVLIPTDFSEASLQAVRWGADIASRFESEVVLVHVIEPVLTSQAMFAGDPSPVLIDSELQVRSDAALREFAGDLLPPDAKYLLRAGRVHQEIIDTIRSEKADLVVVADQGWNALDRWLLGGTTEKLIRKSPVPVLTVK